MFRALQSMATLSLALIIAATSLAATPQLINYQGRLTDVAGNPVTDGAYLIKFQIYADSTGGTALWNGNFQTVNVTNGVYSYILGSQTALPANLFTASDSRWVGITVGTDAEMTPRRRLVATPYALQAAYSDATPWSGLTLVPAGFADGIDNDAGGDITGVTAGTGLTGGGSSGGVGVAVAASGITSALIANATIENIDISGSADISASKIHGTAAALSTSQTFTGTNTFDGSVIVGDSTLRANSVGVWIGRSIAPSSSYLLRLERNYNTTAYRYGVSAYITSSSTGELYAGQFTTENFSEAGGYAYGLMGVAHSNGTYRVGTSGYSEAQDLSITTGYSYGLMGSAYDGNEAFGAMGYAVSATTGYGIYGAAELNGTNWAGYFDGNINVTGSVTKALATVRIDHPLDPENKYLQHALVDSPEMLSIYSGNVTTDDHGFATVELPPYFRALNHDFRYQLTVIRQFAQAIVSQKIEDRAFTIQTDLPHVEVSWQVTGIRQDKFAKANPLVVEIDKKPGERGKYVHPFEWGQSEERGVTWETTRHARDQRQKNASRLKSE